jgi:GntR family transcriptional repressor for pyruvate dehydrogenase complex
MQPDNDSALALKEPAWDDFLGAAGVVPSRLGEAVVVRLTEAILDGKFKPGDPLPSEGRIAAAFGVSKPIAREALRDLAAMGVVQVAQGKLSRVRALDSAPLARFFRFAVGSTAKGLRDAVELRRMLEPQIALHAAQRRSQADIEAFATILARMQAALGDVPRWIEADLAFHAQVALATQNKLVVLQMQGLEPVVREMMRRFNQRAARTPQDWRLTLERHIAVAEAVIAGDDQRAMQTMQAHFAAADEAIEEIFGPAKQTPESH